MPTCYGPYYKYYCIINARYESFIKSGIIILIISRHLTKLTLLEPDFISVSKSLIFTIFMCS